MRARVYLYNQSVKLEFEDIDSIRELEKFLNVYYVISERGFAKEGSDERIYASCIKDKMTYFLHVNQFLHMYKSLENQGNRLEVIEKIDLREYEYDRPGYVIREGWIPRDNQEPIIEFLTTNVGKSKLVPIAPGAGKTMISLYSIGKLDMKMGLVILPMYIDKWVGDIIGIHEANGKEIMVIQGSRAMMSVIALAKSGELDSRYFIFSSKTMQEYIKFYESEPESCVDMYGCAPIDLFPLLRLGILLIDEAHQHFHAIYKVFAHTNVKYNIGLSGTFFLSESHVTNRVQKLIYPDPQVYQGFINDKYVDIYAISYTISPDLLKQVKTSNYGSKNYSHIAFEKSITKRAGSRASYDNLIISTMEDYFLREYKEGDKLLIFVATIDYATHLSKELADMFANYKVRRYCEDDPYENIITADIAVSTVLSAGTAIDIPNLRVVIQTVNIASQVSNIQSLGRLRKLKDRDVKFCYLYANNITKHVQYSRKRYEMFNPIAANIVSRKSRVNVSF